MKHASALLLASYCGLSHAFASSTVHMQDNIWPFQACDLLPPPKISAFIDVCVKRARESQASERERETRERPERERERERRERERERERAVPGTYFGSDLFSLSEFAALLILRRP